MNDDLPYPSESHCDLRATFPVDDLVESCMRAESWFMRWNDLEEVLSFLLSEEDDEHTWGHGAPGSELRSYLIGYLGRDVGRRDLAREHLARAAAWYRERLDEHGGRYSAEIVSQHEAWLAGMESDARSA